MKTKLTALAMTMILVVLVAGCSILEEYAIGASINEVDGTYVDVRTQLWTYDDSGFISNGTWSVSWGDGRLSNEDDAKVVQDVIYEWDHVYYRPGIYEIVVSHGGAEPVFLDVTIE